MTETPTFVSDRKALVLNDAVAAILELDDRRCLLQHRDDKDGIWYPDHWGLFGGGIEHGETAEAAMARELDEELGWRPSSMTPLSDLAFDLKPAGIRSYVRKYFIVRMPTSVMPALRLGEGQEFAAFDLPWALEELRITPYDAFALFLYSQRGRIKSG